MIGSKLGNGSESHPYRHDDRSLRHLPAFGWPVLLGLAAVRLALHFVIGSGYGLFRDEFYYLACGARPDWGYVDQPPLVPMLARLAAAIWGYTTITAGELRTFSALAAAGVIVLAGLMARELGGRTWAQGVAALAVFCGLGFLVLAGAWFFLWHQLDQLAQSADPVRVTVVESQLRLLQQRLARLEQTPPAAAASARRRGWIP